MHGTARLTDNARQILVARYLKKSSAGQAIEAPEDMIMRVAKAVAKPSTSYGEIEEVWAEMFYTMMANGDFMPNSPTLMNAGRPLGQLSACFVLPISDCISNGKDGIYDTLTHMALIHKSGGGTGFSFSNLRGTGSMVKSTTGVASGPVSFMKLYDASTSVVKQGGTRRGANMGILRIDHPDIIEFIRCKSNVDEITNFNISVAITDSFMMSVQANAPWNLYDNNRNVVEKLPSARDLFSEIVYRSWATGEPGIFFIDAANRSNPVPHLGAYESTNPCGEQPLLPYDVCNLGSINLGNFVRQNGPVSSVDWDRLKNVIYRAVVFLDNVIDANNYPLPQIEDLAKRVRRIGLGPMGWADMLVRMKIPYGSPESIRLAHQVSKFFKHWAHWSSEQLADRRGVFPEWSNSVLRKPMRNCNVTTVAPTGTISIFADCSGGIEPLFAAAFYRNQAGFKMVEYNKDYREALNGWTQNEATTDNILSETAQLGQIPAYVPDHIRRIFVTAHDITPNQHIDMQATWQCNIDSAISKTVNFPHHATPKDVEDIYFKAWESGCKGVTVYRDGSRPGQVLSTGATEKQDNGNCPTCTLPLTYEEGCVTCHACGYSACSIG